MTYTLRPQQVEFESAIREAFRSHRCVLATAPTGFGKGVVIADMGLKAVERRRKVLIVTNRRQIVLQLNEHCQRAGVHCGIIMGSEEPDHAAPLQVASIQTLKRRNFVDMETPGFIIVDEAHQEHEAYRRLLRERFASVQALGLTATPVGPGGARIGHFDVIVEPIKNTAVIAAGHLLKVTPYLAPSEPDLGGINLKTASMDEVGRKVDSCTVYGDVFAEWEPYKDLQTMVVLPSRAVCNQFHRLALDRGISAKIVDGTTEQDERNATFREFKAEDCQMLLGVDVIREGLDLPDRPMPDRPATDSAVPGLLAEARAYQAPASWAGICRRSRLRRQSAPSHGTPGPRSALGGRDEGPDDRGSEREEGRRPMPKVR